MKVRKAAKELQRAVRDAMDDDDAAIAHEIRAAIGTAGAGALGALIGSLIVAVGIDDARALLVDAADALDRLTA